MERAVEEKRTLPTREKKCRDTGTNLRGNAPEAWNLEATWTLGTSTHTRTQARFEGSLLVL